MQPAPYSLLLRRLATVMATTVITLASIAATTGILLSIYYEPTATGAFNSLREISQEIPNGWLIRSVHNIAGNVLIVAALVQLVVMFLGERLNRNWLIGWASLILLVLTAIGLGWTAMLLDWSQTGYWRFRIELGTIESIPFVGNQIRDILTGGAVNSMTVKRLYTLHSYILSTGAIALAAVHLGSLLMQAKMDRSIEQSSDVSSTSESPS